MTHSRCLYQSFYYTPCFLPTITRPHPINTSPNIKNSFGSKEPSPVFGVSSSVWLPDVVPVVLAEPELPDQRTVALAPCELPEDVPAVLAEPELPDVVPVPDDEPDPLPVPAFEELPDPLPELDSPKSMDVLPAPSSSISSLVLLPEPDVSSLKSTLVLPAAESSSSSSLSSEELPPSRLLNA